MTMFTLFNLIQLVLGILMYTMIGQGLLALLLGEGRDKNAVYLFITKLTRPAWKVTRFITPRFIVDRHIALLTFLLLIVLRVVIYMVFYSQGWLPTDLGAPR